MRTDIPAFYSKWLMNRIREGYVLVRNPYYPSQVTRYSLSPKVVDIEPIVPDKRKVIESFKKLSKHIGVNSIGWRYDPIFIGNEFDVNKHIECFEKWQKV